MAVSPTTKNIIAAMVISVNGVDLKARVLKCGYSIERSSDSRGVSGGTISLDLIFDIKSKEFSQLLTDDGKTLTGAITCKTGAGDLGRTISFYDAVPKTFSEAIDVKNPTALVSVIHLQAARISVT